MQQGFIKFGLTICKVIHNRWSVLLRKGEAVSNCRYGFTVSFSRKNMIILIPTNIK